MSTERMNCGSGSGLPDYQFRAGGNENEIFLRTPNSTEWGCVFTIHPLTISESARLLSELQSLLRVEDKCGVATEIIDELLHQWAGNRSENDGFSRMMERVKRFKAVKSKGWCDTCQRNTTYTVNGTGMWICDLCRCDNTPNTKLSGGEKSTDQRS